MTFFICQFALSVKQFCKLFETICKIVLQIGKSVNYFSAFVKDAV
ncbi:Uncharacterized protein dnm_009830 [Desulfonema magnum]|uniref:Uncharacterized protein n=1 Tax=Desulfonema magnum TaxID=45655 RepID=A0A975BFV2_9BACT|nr:Uncharacterized protein dnm_009830 [Desulfonema magnum]